MARTRPQDERGVFNGITRTESGCCLHNREKETVKCCSTIIIITVIYMLIITAINIENNWIEESVEINVTIVGYVEYNQDRVNRIYPRNDVYMAVSKKDKGTTYSPLILENDYDIGFIYLTSYGYIDDRNKLHSQLEKEYGLKGTNITIRYNPHRYPRVKIDANYIDPSFVGVVWLILVNIVLMIYTVNSCRSSIKLIR